MSKFHLKLCSLLIFFIFYLYPFKIQAANLLANPRFEDVSDTTSWKQNNSSVVFSLTDDEHFEASRSAKITNPKTSSFGIEQIVMDISPSLTYKILSYAKPIFPYDKVFIRIAWYKSQDASGAQLSTDDSNFAQGQDWQKIELIKTPPESVYSAKIRLLVASGEAYFDETSFEEYFPPIQTPAPSPTPSPAQSPTIYLSPTSIASSTPVPLPVSNIYISEVMVDPLAGENEWVELYNNNDFSLQLTDWFIDDGQNSGSTPKIFSLSIDAKNYAVVDLTSSIFNNNQDSVRLLDSGMSQKDGFEFADSEKGKSLSRTSFDTDIFCLTDPSKGLPNLQCQNTPTAKSSTVTVGNGQDPSPLLQNENFASEQIRQKINVPNYSILQSQNPQVLGEDTNLNEYLDHPSVPNNKNLKKALSIVSFSYSLLTIASILLKIKNSV